MARTARKIRYAVVGLGYISQIAMLPAFANARGSSRLAALVSDDRAKLEKLGRQYRAPIRATYREFDALCASGEIDAVYIGLPNTMHREYVERAARAGVHVLCDKPLAAELDEAQRLVDACRRAGVRLMTAYRLHFEPANLAAIELATSGKLGELRYFTSQFAMQVRAPNIRTDAELGGGPLLDIGIYCINAVRNLFRDEPIEASGQAVAGADPRFREVPEMVQAQLRFPGGRIASFTCSYGSADTSVFQLHGTKGKVELREAYEMVGPKELQVDIGGKKQTRRFAKRDQFAPVIEHFSECVLAGRDPAPSGDEGLADLRAIDAIERAIARGRTVALRGRAPHGRRPRAAQRGNKPPVRKRTLFHARKPSR